MLNQKILNLSESGTVALADRVRKLQAEGKRVIPLHTGDPDFNTPFPVSEMAYKCMKDGLTHYTYSRGIPVLREAIAADIAQKTGANFNPETEILITNGGVHACFTGLTAILNPGDEVLVQDPTWMSHRNLVGLAGGVAVSVPARPENGFFPTIEDLQAAVTPRTRAMIINSPGNPTGAIASPEYLLQIAEFIEKNDLYLLSDEVYDTILFDGAEHTSSVSIPALRNRTLLINSFSKSYAMTGWRLGYLAAPANVISQALKALQLTVTNIPPYSQYAALEALTNPQSRELANEMYRAYQRRADLVMELAEEANNSAIGLIKPKGAFYYFVDIRGLGWGNSEETAHKLLNEQLVAAVPGSVFGQYGEGFLRMTIAASEDDIREGFSRLLECQQLTPASYSTSVLTA